MIGRIKINVIRLTAKKERTVPPWAIVKHSASMALLDLSKEIAFIGLLEQTHVETEVTTLRKY